MYICESKYKELDSAVLENDHLRVEIVPDAGARTASIIFKPMCTELLWQNPASNHAPVRYTQPYGQGEFAGFDEMLPTIDECFYPDFPWKGTEIPDHGEVWALPWSREIENDSVLLSVHGVRLPYRLSKKVRLNGAVLRAVYRLENLSPFPMPFIYAAHPLFNVSEGDSIAVPENLDAVINAVSSVGMPSYGKEYSFPVDGDVDLSVVPPRNKNGYKKFYFLKRNTYGWSLLRREKLGIDIKMSCTADKLPYLGIWMNEGGWDDQYNLALEPASASMDSVTSAKNWGCESILNPGEIREWEMDIAVEIIR